MNLETARIMVEAGHPEVKFAIIAPLIDVPGGWQLCFGPSWNWTEHTLESRRGRRVFKTLDAANRQAADLGFKYVSVYNPQVK